MVKNKTLGGARFPKTIFLLHVPKLPRKAVFEGRCIWSGRSPCQLTGVDCGGLDMLNVKMMQTDSRDV